MRLIWSTMRLISSMRADVWHRESGPIAARDFARLSLFFTRYLQAARFF
jgi:hypothetical protein